MKRTKGWWLTLAAAGGCMAGGCTSSDSFLAPPPPNMMGVAPRVNAVGPFGEPLQAPPSAMPMMPNPAAMSQAAAAGVIPASFQPGGPFNPPAAGVPGGMECGPGGCGAGGGAGGAMAGQGLMRSQVRFVGPAGAKIGWYVAQGGEGGQATMMPYQLDLPGRYNFLQASIYRLKLSNINGRPGLELYPTIEVVPGNPKTDAFLAHNYIPVDFTEEDFDQVTAGNFITKVIYLPDVQFSGGAGGAEELSSTRLDPGVDPIAEAQRRGHILLVVRLGGIDLEARNTPGMMDHGGPPVGAMPPQMPPQSAVKPAVMTQERGVLGEMKQKASGAAYPQTAIPAPSDLDGRVKMSRKTVFGD